MSTCHGFLRQRQILADPFYQFAFSPISAPSNRRTPLLFTHECGMRNMACSPH